MTWWHLSNQKSRRILRVIIRSCFLFFSPSRLLFTILPFYCGNWFVSQSFSISLIPLFLLFLSHMIHTQTRKHPQSIYTFKKLALRRLNFIKFTHSKVLKSKALSPLSYLHFEPQLQLAELKFISLKGISYINEQLLQGTRYLLKHPTQIHPSLANVGRFEGHCYTYLNRPWRQ